MPTYKNNRQALIYLEGKHNETAGMVDGRAIDAGAVFTAKTTDIPARWLEGAAPWVTLLSESPTDEELSS